ncbi:MAG: MFS transporter [Dehalococcoidia bacterium]
MSAGTESTRTPAAALADPARGRGAALALVSFATLLSLSVWFSTNAISDVLEMDKGFTTSSLAWATIAVQLGFVAGTFLIALTNLSDLINARTLFAASAVTAGLLNLAIIPIDGEATMIAVRFATGAMLAGVYPPAMKVISGWFARGRGLALGVMVGALTIGSGSPHLLRSFFADNWEAVIVGSSILAVIGGAVVRGFVKDGPHDVRGAKFAPRYMLRMFTDRGPRLALFGYLGHMWELYAMWAWIGVFLAAVVSVQPLLAGRLDLASALTFAVFLAGAVACPLAGMMAERIGRTYVTSLAMILSGGTALVIGFVPVSLAPLIVVLALVWGASVIADSAQFSTAVTELSEPEYRGTMLTFQMGLGFALTAVTIWLVPVVQEAAGWGAAFAMLAIGPALGTAAMLILRRMPEARMMAGGRG